MSVRLDIQGLGAMLQSSGVQKAVTAAANAVAANASHTTSKGEEIPVVVTPYTTAGMRINRAAAAVSLAHPAGPAVQAKHGTLTKAAAAAGLAVKARKGKK